MLWIHKIHGMDIRSVDLNLLVVFEALARLRSVNRTAEAMGLSQPATRSSIADCSFARAAMSSAVFSQAISGWRRMVPVAEQGASSRIASKR